MLIYNQIHIIIIYFLPSLILHLLDNDHWIIKEVCIGYLNY